MHGAPLLHGVEIYRGRPIFYDLGNFIYNVPPTLTYIDEPMSWESVVASIRMQGKRVLSISLRPVILNTIGDRRTGRLHPATGCRRVDAVRDTSRRDR